MARGRLAQSQQAFERALGAHAQRPVPAQLARTLLHLGRLQRRRRMRRVARENLLKAQDIFAGLGAVYWRDRCAGELARLGTAPGAGDALTSSQRRVAELAARGLTNRAVAAELFMSEKTVEAHLTNVYRKLDIHSRAQLVMRWGEDAGGAPVSSAGD
ncbi:MAG: helix-turn-helix transcriptional regulator [Thermoleophilia bacterium]